MTRSPLTLVAIALAALLLLGDSVFVVDETKQVVITQFGNPVGNPITTPGLHAKLPLIQKAHFFDKRFLEWDGDANQMPTRDKRFIWVDTYARWRINDPLRFFQRLRDERGAQSRLDDILDGETRNAVARHDQVEVVRSSNRPPEAILVDSEEETAILQTIAKGRQAITNEILEAASRRTADLGIELIDLRIKRINYVDQVQRDVFARMIAERRRVGERYRSEGAGESARIGGEKQRELQRISSEAYMKAQEIRGKADAEATRIYAEAYGRDPAFYAFVKSLETFEQAADQRTILVLTTSSDMLKVLKKP
ncbi:MAG: protease modulator HflC [Acidobacteriota bacterium]|jgi:membrane protease subunit HflC